MHHMRYFCVGKHSRASLCYWKESHSVGRSRGSSLSTRDRAFLAVHKELSAPPRQRDWSSKVLSTRSKASSWEKTGNFVALLLEVHNRQCETNSDPGVIPLKLCKREGNWWYKVNIFFHQSDAIRYPFPSADFCLKEENSEEPLFSRNLWGLRPAQNKQWGKVQSLHQAEGEARVTLQVSPIYNK